MNFDTLTDYALNFYSSYPFVVVAFALVLLFLAYKKPKESFKFAIFVLFMAAVFYALGTFRDTLSTGTQSANEGIQKSKNLED
jgi:lipopolysaccharide export LptBFGC system permease protein LptF